MNKIEELEKKIKELQDEVQKLKDKPSKVWKPAIDDDYWRIMTNNEVGCENWNGDTFDEYNYSIGNCFRTKEEAEFAIEKLKVIAELKRFAEEYNDGEFNWDDDIRIKWDLCYDNSAQSVGVYCNRTAKKCGIYFTYESIAKQAIQTIGEERLKKYYFEVK